MRELILLRHAHAEPAAPGQADADRALSLRGQAEAEAAARWLKSEGLLPARVLCSPARRTRETLARVLEVLGYSDVRYEPRIYDALPGTLMAVLDEHVDVD
ncbi:MAG: SixA phosphatase family protein, partial [Lysobacteraceae bacterium]